MSIIKNGKSNVMPAQSGWLSPEQIHVLAAYVLSLSGPAPAAVGSIALPARTP